jgi:hypothetical protein
MLRLTRAEIGEIFKQTKIDGECVLHFPCEECNEIVDSLTHPKMSEVLIKYFNEEVSRQLEPIMKIVIEDSHIC